MENTFTNTKPKKEWQPLKLEILDVGRTNEMPSGEIWGFGASGDFWKRELVGS